jgi:hypothetical protein
MFSAECRFYNVYSVEKGMVVYKLKLLLENQIKHNMCWNMKTAIKRHGQVIFSLFLANISVPLNKSV